MAMALTRRQFVAGTALPFTPLFAQENTPRLPRKDCYFGLHFDLHPQKTDTALGRDLTDEMADRLLTRVKPDFLQYDCKGHAGYLGFKSATGTSSPGIVKDSLEIWRRAMARRGVGLYIHFSGVWDSVAVAEHPDWARVTPDGKPDDRLTSTFGPYVDRLMIPELDEAMTKYSLDGAWIDGECWAVAPDYSNRARDMFRERTGISELPAKPGDQGWLEFLELNREQFRRYVRHYIDDLHRRHPGVQIASNWLYSSFVPERPEIPVDYLSGDFLGTTPVSNARLEARYLASAGKTWDLMAWGFVVDRAGKTHIHKRPAQLKQEAAAVITQGGGFQIYYNPTRAGWIDDRLVDVMAEVARFCRERQAASFQTKPVPQVAVLFSRHSLYRTSNRLFGGWGSAEDPVRGTIDALLAARYSVEILPDWKLAETARYPLIVVPDWPDIGQEARTSLAAYVRGGGALVLLGAENAAGFAELAGIRVTSTREQEGDVLGDTGFAPVHGAWADFDTAGARVVEQRFPAYDARQGGVPAAAIVTAGRGKVVVIPGPVGAVYASYHPAALSEFLRRMVRRVFVPAIEVQGPGVVEVSLREKDGWWLVHLSNMTAMQVGPEYPVVDAVPSVGPLDVAVRLPRRPAVARWDPGGGRLDGRWADGAFRTTVDRLDVHGVVAIELA